MPRYLTMAGSTALTLTLLAFAGVATAAPVPALDGAANLVVLTGDDENAEVKNFLDPEADNGSPANESAGTRPEGEHVAAPPQGGDSAERALESTVGDDGINAIQRESIPEKGGN